MGRIKIIIAVVVLAIGVTAGWQIGAAEVANLNLQEDMRDMASQAGTHVGFIAPPSDDELTANVVRRAKEHGLDISPDQVTVRRINPGEKSTLYLAADYTVPVNLLALTLHLHFTPSSEKR